MYKSEEEVLNYWHTLILPFVSVNLITAIKMYGFQQICFVKHQTININLYYIETVINLRPMKRRNFYYKEATSEFRQLVRCPNEITMLPLYEPTTRRGLQLRNELEPVPPNACVRDVHPNLR
jgi:hypothetical protein